jgi:hypothetical protein
MERIGAGVSIVVFLVMVLPSFLLAQSKEEGERISAEAYNLEQNAKTTGDKEAALEKYKQVIAIFEKVGHRKGGRESIEQRRICLLFSRPTQPGNRVL